MVVTLAKKVVKKVGKTVWDRIPTRQEVLDFPEKVGKTVWKTIPTRQEVRDLPEKLWDRVPTQQELLTKFQNIEKGIEEFDPKEFLTLMASEKVNQMIRTRTAVREAFLKLIKCDPQIAAFFFDTIDGNTYSEAFKQAREKGLKTFIWSKNGQVYSTEYAGTPKEQMDVYGLVNEQMQDPTWWEKRVANNVKDMNYSTGSQLLKRVWNTVVLNQQEQRNMTEDERDYFNTYVGKPQVNGILGISNYRPANSSEKKWKRVARICG